MKATIIVSTTTASRFELKADELLEAGYVLREFTAVAEPYEEPVYQQERITVIRYVGLFIHINYAPR